MFGHSNIIYGPNGTLRSVYELKKILVFVLEDDSLLFLKRNLMQYKSIFVLVRPLHFHAKFGYSNIKYEPY